VAVLYAGEEIGMLDADPATLPQPPYDRAGRDGCRTPMQWDATPSGGFTRGTPWLPLVDPAIRNVEAQRGDDRSLLALYRRLIAARASVPALRRGTHRSIFGVSPDVLAWTRELDGERLLVLLNTGGETRTCALERVDAATGEVVVGTGAQSGRRELAGLRLEPLEGLALRL
jgi:alpha-glucosidase